MLALTRKKDQAVMINGNIEIRILDIQDGKVKLGITAPKDVSIHREEVYIEIENNNQEALINSADTMKSLQQLFK
ncbi:carbon storage regulator CsrA [Niameybacter massiliensis]|uniref:carbon storage regulator CsrA n=1 Tax=Niameybacter massiliensis TaxID=1658108 RepID=UPI0006B4251E|nr:carbon storage regulator CsrA [Niameybacter massiliensis]